MERKIYMDDCYENQYFGILNNISKYGTVECNERTKTTRKRIPHSVISVDLEEEFPILMSKKVAWKTALDEILWIMQKQSNNIRDLNSHIWDSWADKDGSIGKAYGYQVEKSVHALNRSYMSQVHYVLESLKEDPSSARAVIDLWNVDDLRSMGLSPCCYTTHWTIIDGRLNCVLMQRSADFLVGVPFNTTQYAMLTHLFAKSLCVKPGLLTHIMSDVHIYPEYQQEGFEQTLKNYETVKEKGYDNHAKFIINSEETDFFKIRKEDCDVIDYKNEGLVKFGVAV